MPIADTHRCPFHPLVPMPKETRKASDSEVYGTLVPLPPRCPHSRRTDQKLLDSGGALTAPKATSQTRARALCSARTLAPGFRRRTGNHLDQSGVVVVVCVCVTSGHQRNRGIGIKEPWSGRFYPRPGASCLPSPPTPLDSFTTRVN